MNVEQLYLSNYTSPLLSSPALSLAAKVRYGSPSAGHNFGRAGGSFRVLWAFRRRVGNSSPAVVAVASAGRAREGKGGGGPIFETPSKGDLRLNLSRSPLLCLLSPLFCSRPLKPRSNTVCPCLPFKNSIVFVGLSAHPPDWALPPPTYPPQASTPYTIRYSHTSRLPV